jgi:transcription-repair coupling factor (superfamily II helicase)
MLKTLLASDHMRALHHAIQGGDSILVEELWNAPKALMAAEALAATGKHLLILTGASHEENKLYHDFAFFTKRAVIDFPAWETLPSEGVPPSPDVVGDRYRSLHEMMTTAEPLIILSSLQAVLQKLIPRKTFFSLYLTLKKGDAPGFETLIQKLIEMGYRRNHVASDKGEFAVRGGIIDVFPVSSPDPFRLEFFGDEIENIRIYDPVGQKSVKSAENLSITPALELEFLKAETELQTLLDYLGKDVIVVFDDLLSLEDRYATLLSICGTPGANFCTIEAFLTQVESLQKIFWTEQPIEDLSEIKVVGREGPFSTLVFEAFNRQFTAKRFRHPFVPIPDYLMLEEGSSGDAIIPALRQMQKSESTLYLLSASDVEQTTFIKKITAAEIELPEKTFYESGYLSSGFAVHDSNIVVLPFAEISRRYKIRRQKMRSTYHTPPSEFYHLSPGESVVHMNNGIGKFLGLERKIDHNGVESEFFHIEYAENSKLFVPMNQAHLLTKYIGSDDGAPLLSKLGSSRWKHAREKTERAVLGYANDLLKMYAERTVRGGFCYPEETPEEIAFSEEFPFVETEDQLAAIGAINRDMCSTKPMDRLICGDVGYGKTEVAMRAAFKAVAGGKQVAILVPTTVLAMQHYENFMDRMSNFPVRVGVLSRFRKPKEIRETLEGVAKGSVDILIGTHRIVGQDVLFKDLGLVIIDEEQRFGVRAKEHLKKIKTGVDCLTLSATPIPRTLYMSLVGARDMSIINTPPQDRLPITSLVTESSDQIIKNALLRELSRGGQSYVIHNHVATIFAFADRIKEMIPEARIAVGHGQMGSDELDEVFHAFKHGRADILVATSIVESGIDIPNANTIIIDRSDRFGLADLYQLRGRVGRWNRRAYAYFFVPSRRELNEIARRRLQALAESSGYGGGMKLAMNDLEIRGAGNILGEEQSGYVAAVGFHLYCKMLKRTIRALQGQGSATLVDCKVDIPVDARLSSDYVNAPSLRMEIYQRLGEAVSLDELESIWEEIQDRFGEPPLSAKWLYHTARLRTVASQEHITHLKLENLYLLMERKGKEPQVKKVFIGKTTTPEELEAKIIEKIKEFK